MSKKRNPNLSRRPEFISMKNETAKKRILSVEDDADSCDLIQFVLSEYEVIFAKNVGEAIHIFDSGKFHLCLLDNWLSDGIGVDLCARIRRIDKNIPIIFASGIGNPHDVQKAIEAGAQAFLIKPYFPEDLQKIVKELISKSV